jgi:hypothetical protein
MASFFWRGLDMCTMVSETCYVVEEYSAVELSKQKYTSSLRYEVTKMLSYKQSSVLEQS